MEDMQSKIGAILNDPEAMQKIMSMAQTLGQGSHADGKENAKPDAPQHPDTPAFSLQDIDLGAIQKIASLTQKTGIDHNQKALLKALGPYLSRERVSKLERAMRAARMASIASSFLGTNSLLSKQSR